MKVKFKVTDVFDHAKQGSEVEEGAILIGELDAHDRIYYTDNVGSDWAFYVNDTCQIVSFLTENQHLNKTV